MRRAGLRFALTFALAAALFALALSREWLSLPPECLFFDGVLSPDHNAAHRDHLHLDRGPCAPRYGSYKPTTALKLRPTRIIWRNVCARTYC
jgi:hypothetical protein